MSADAIAGLQEQIAALTAAVTNMKTPADQQAEDQPVKADPAVDELKTQNQALTDQVQQIMKLLDTEPAQRTGYVTPDGGTADRNVKSFGDFVKAIGRRDHKRLSEVYGATKALEENSGTTGGYLVPTQFVNQLTEYAAEQAIVKPRAFRLDMTGREAEIPAIDYANTAYSRGSTVFTAGMVMEWTAERKKVPNTEPKFRQMQLEAHKMSGLVPVSNELLSDSGQALEQLLVRLFGTAIAFAEDYAFLAGDGQGKPLGVLEAPATITTATALTAAAPTVAELSSMYSRLMIQSKQTAVWVINQLLVDALMSINATASSNTTLTWLRDIRGDSGGSMPNLFGRPVIMTEKLPTSFAEGGLILADFQQYVVGNRQEIEIAMSEHAGFNRDETQWRCIARCDGQPYMNGPVKIGSGANDTVSAFVKSK
jgi:HK97 family phage major capsid protein